MPGQRIAAVAGFCEASRVSPDDAKQPGFNADADVEGAAGAAPAIGAVAIIGGARLAVILIADRAAQTPSRDHPPSVFLFSLCTIACRLPLLNPLLDNPVSSAAACLSRRPVQATRRGTRAFLTPMPSPADLSKVR